MSVVNIAFYIIAIVAFVLGIVSLIQLKHKSGSPGPPGPPGSPGSPGSSSDCVSYLEHKYKTNPLLITVANATNATNATNLANSGPKGETISAKQFCQCRYNTKDPKGYFTMEQPNAGTPPQPLKPGSLKFSNYCPTLQSKGPCSSPGAVNPFGSWQAWPGGGGIEPGDFSAFNK